MLAIYKKELRSYFNSMMGYVFMAFFLVIMGIYFTVYNMLSGYSGFEITLNSVIFIFVLLVPLLTMRLMAEENKQKTDQLLFTSPISATSIVIGKLLAVFTIFIFVMLVTCLYPVIMTLYGKVGIASSYAGIFAFVLLGAAYLSIGLFISSLTENQVVAAVITFVTFLITLLMEGIASFLPADNRSAVVIFTVLVVVIGLIIYLVMRNLTIAVIVGILAEAGLVAVYVLKPTILDGSVKNVLGWLSVVSRFNNFGLGIFDISAIVYYLSITVLFAFLTIQVIKKKRWS